jgi:glycosyltransferase involved in cell wall biosynthesis
MTKPLISVLIDTYNYGRFIEQAIESVLSQEFPQDLVEILVVDDGSTDDTAERVRKYGSKVRYLYKRNGGQGSAFNLGFQHARGDLIAFLDADDYFLPGKLRRTVEEFQKHREAGMIYHPLLELDATCNEFRETQIVAISGFLADDKSKLLAYRIYPTSSMVFRRHALGQILPMPETIRLQADRYLGLLIPLIAPVVALPEALSVYRIHGQNLYSSQDAQGSKERDRRRYEMVRIISKEIKAWARSRKHLLKYPETRVFLGSWSLGAEEEEFLIKPPGRFRFLSFLLKQNYTFSSEQTWKLTTYNYVATFLALVFGYKKSDLMYAFRGRAMRAFQSLVGKFSPAHAKRKAPGMRA